MKAPHETKLSGTEEIPPLDASTRPVRLESRAGWAGNNVNADILNLAVSKIWASKLYTVTLLAYIK